MADEPLQIQPSTKVAQLLDAYPELEEVLIRQRLSHMDGAGAGQFVQELFHQLRLK